MRSAATHLSGLAAWAHAAGGSVRPVLRWMSQHTGLPVTLVCAIALVVSFHLLRRTLRFGIEVALVAVLLVTATRFGWLRW